MSERIRPAAVAEITSLSLRKVQEMAAAGQLPGAAKLGGVWTFDPTQIRAWIRHQERKAACRANYPTTATVAATSSGDVSMLPDESIAQAYEQLIRKKQRSGSARGAKNLSASQSASKARTHSKRQSFGGRGKSSPHP